MSLVLKDRVRETTTVLGTNDATLLGAVTGFQAFSVVGNGNTCYYTISDQSGGNWEVGIGTYSTVGPTLARTTILASSNSGSIVSFPAGTKDVFLTLPAEVAVVSSNNPSTAGYVLSSNGTGVAPSWVAGTSITVGAAGSNTQVQYNNSGVLGASSNFTFDGTNIGLAGGTANGVAYLNGSKVLTTGSALTFDGTSLGVSGNNAAHTTYLTLTNNSTAGYGPKLDFNIGYGGGYTSAELQSGATGTNGGYLQFYTKPDGGSLRPAQILYDNYTAWYATGSEQMRLTSTGLGIGTSSPDSTTKLDIQNSSSTTWTPDSSAVQSRVFNTSSTANGTGLYGAFANYSDGSYTGVKFGAVATGSYSAAFVVANRSAGTYYERMRLDSSGNLGLGVTPRFVNGYTTFEVKDASLVSSGGADLELSCNAYYNFGWKYSTSTWASRYEQYEGKHSWFTAPSGTAGNAISFTQAMTLDASGNLLLGTTTSTGLTTNQFQLGTTSNANSGIQVLSNTTGTGGIYFGDSTSGAGRYSGYLEYNHSTNAMLFTTDATERMRIDSSGNVGIGTSSPSGKLNVSNAGTTGLEFYPDYLPDSTSGTRIQSYNRNTSAYVTQGYNANDFRWYTASTERMRIDSSGNLGLGVTPSAWSSASTPAFQLKNGAALYSRSTSTHLAQNFFYNSSDAGTYINNGYVTLYAQNSTNGQHQWYNAPSGTAGSTASLTQAMTLDASGNLGIGTSSPAELLHLTSSGGNTFPVIRLTGSNRGGAIDMYNQGYPVARIYSDQSGNILFQSSKGFSQTTLQDVMLIDSSGNVGIGTSSPSYRLHVEATSPTSGRLLRIVSTGVGAGYVGVASTGNTFVDANTTGTSLEFRTQDTERMRIDSSGNMLVGMTSQLTAGKVEIKSSGNTNASKGIYICNSDSNDLFFARSDGLISTGAVSLSPYNNTTASAANMYVNSSGQLGRSTSSLKYKTDVQDSSHGLADVMKLRSVTYKGKNDGDTVFGGLIAEEVDAAGLKEFVQYAEDGSPDALAYGNMVSLCIKAIQELKAELDATKAEVAALKAK